MQPVYYIGLDVHKRKRQRSRDFSCERSGQTDVA